MGRHVWRAVLALMVALLGGAAMAIEQPKYSVSLHEGDFEVRRYAPYVVAEVEVSGDQGQAVRTGFRKLAGYIFGANAGQTKIAMTAPVAQQPAGERIAMTSPVTQTPLAPDRWTVQFMMPSAYTLSTLPKPTDPDVRFRQEPARLMAALRYSGVAREANFREKSEALGRFIAAKGFKAAGPSVLAQYDPPWTPWFMRRNEVLAPIER